MEIRLVNPRDPDAQRCVLAYYEELSRRDPPGFDPATGVSAEPEELEPPNGAFLVAYLDGEAVGCGGVKHPPGVAEAEVKRMWVAEFARGRGIAGRLLVELEARAAAAGATTTRLETNRTLAEAMAMYRARGYEEVEPFNDEPFAHHWFAKRLAPG